MRRISTSEAAIIAPVEPAETAATAPPSRTARQRGHEGGVLLGPDGVRRLLVVADDLGRVDDVDAGRQRAAELLAGSAALAAQEHADLAGGGGQDRTCHGLAWARGLLPSRRARR